MMKRDSRYFYINFIIAAMLLLCFFLSLPRGAVGWFVILAFPGHLFLLSLITKVKNEQKI